MDDIGGRVKAARELKGWSMSRLSQEAGVSKGYLSQLEASAQTNPSLDILKKIVDALDTTVGHLIGASVAVTTAKPQPAEWRWVDGNPTEPGWCWLGLRNDCGDATHKRIARIAMVDTGDDGPYPHEYRDGRVIRLPSDGKRVHCAVPLPDGR